MNRLILGRGGVVGQRLVANLPADPVGFWLGYVEPVTRPTYRRLLNRWIYWLNTQPGWEHVTARDVLVRYLEAEDPYVVLDLVEIWVRDLQLRKTSKKHALTTIRSYFMHNRCQLPDNPHFRISSQRPNVRGMLTTADVLELCHAAPLRFRSLILFKWQSFIDTARLLYANEHCCDQVVQQIQRGRPPGSNRPPRTQSERERRRRQLLHVHRQGRRRHARQIFR